jgi:hypothetical protein
MARPPQERCPLPWLPSSRRAKTPRCASSPTSAGCTASATWPTTRSRPGPAEHRTTVQSALRKARELGLITVQNRGRQEIEAVRKGLDEAERSGKGGIGAGRELRAKRAIPEAPRCSRRHAPAESELSPRRLRSAPGSGRWGRPWSRPRSAGPGAGRGGWSGGSAGGSSSR